MSLDGIMLAAIRNELNNALVGGRIDKIYQIPENTITLTIRNNNSNHQLVVSANPQHARLHLSELSYENPIKPPDFCMLLRKYIQRSIVERIEQPDFERIIIFHLKQRNTLYYLIIEIMGKYSNISLVDENSNILDSIRRVTAQQSQERQLFPGIKYKYPPAQDKLNPLKAEIEEFEQTENNKTEPLYKLIMNNYRGIGPDSAREIVYRAGLDYQKPISLIKEEEQISLWKSFKDYFQNIQQANTNPTVGLNKEGNIEYISAFTLTYKVDIKPITFNSTGKLFDYYYLNKIKLQKVQNEQHKLLNVVNSYLTKNQNQYIKYKKELKQAQTAEIYKEKGDLIKANIYKMKKGLEQIDVVNYYDPEQQTITIELDPSLTPAENAQKYFKRYQKAKKSINHIKRQLGILKHEEKYLEQVLLNIQQVESLEELNLIEQELKDEGYIKTRNNKKRKKQSIPLPPHHFKSSQGYDILVGRNNYQNDQLTQKIANRDDLWFHVKDIAGSHVILRNHTGKEIPPTTIKEAASLAAYYSKGRMSTNVPVDYTEVKNVKKPKGAKPGLVYYENYQTLYVNPEEEVVNKLKTNS